jgi:LPS sulfotransferase NodH
MSADKYFCMIHEGRCGSTVLASLISQSPGIAHFNEILTRGSWVSQDFSGSEMERLRDAYQIRLPELCGFVRQLINHKIAKSHSHFISFELKFNQFSQMQLSCDLPSLVETLDCGLGRVRYMFLTRRNILRRHVSTLRCLYMGVSHASKIEEINFEKIKVTGETMSDWSYDFTQLYPSLHALLEASEANQNKVREYATRNGHLYMEYEDFEQDPLSGAHQILDFLGLPRFRAESPWLKSGDLPLADFIENFDEVFCALANTRWAWMLG